jgi:23S rRNA (uridine2552-2'-O)-methyltransferase
VTPPRKGPRGKAAKSGGSGKAAKSGGSGKAAKPAKSAKNASPGGRGITVRVKTAKGRKISSIRWLDRQLNDPYVREAERLGYRSRAAFKLIGLDDRFNLLAPGRRVVDLGAAPGGWTQVAVERVRPETTGGQVIALDLTPIDPIPGSTFINLDFLADEAPDALKAALGGPADVVMSDMASPAIGHTKTDHLRIVALCEVAFAFAAEVLAPDGAFIAKVLQGGAENDLLTAVKQQFAKVHHAKPPASRSDSAEMYLVATGFRAVKTD